MKKRFLALAVSLVVATSAMASDLQLQAIGASVASNLYLSYLSMGVIADSYTKKVYSKDQTLSFVSSVVAQGGVQKDYLQKMIASGDIPENDQEFVQKMIKCFELLIDEGNFLNDYVRKGDNDSLAKYDNKRKEAWALISEIMGFGK
ncbi:MAG TPA: hypothetical protein PK358_17320 [Spirochaetota bacterium]|nr:hypothetical protein [Spirochaetota bacterium]HPJ36602.1 hypothetical protein [Spirochaetota bacterium]